MALRVLGALLVLAGAVLAFAPTLVSDPGPAPDLFEAIERHTRWGALVGIGALLIARTQLRPWRITLAHLVLWLSAGYLVARAIGLAVEGTESGQQWMLFGLEIVLIVIAVAYLWRKREAAAKPD